MGSCGGVELTLPDHRHPADDGRQAKTQLQVRRSLHLPGYYLPLRYNPSGLRIHVNKKEHHMVY